MNNSETEMVLVTGSTGLVGAHLIRRLIQSGHKVRALHRSTSRMELLEDLKNQIDWFEGDLLDIPSLEDAFQGTTKVYHCGAMISFDPSQQFEMLKINREGTANIVNCCIDFKVEKLLYVSSVAALGRNKNQDEIDENASWEYKVKPSNYGTSKMLAEREVWRAQAEGLPAVIVNPSTILGAGFWANGSNKIFEQVANGLSFYTLGSNGFVDVRDVVDCSISLMNSDVDGEQFILNSDTLSFKDFFAMVANGLNVSVPSKAVKGWMGEVAWRWEWFRTKLSGSKPIITKETIDIAKQHCNYSNQKVVNQLDFQFRPIQESIAEVCDIFRQSQQAGLDYGIIKSW